MSENRKNFLIDYFRESYDALGIKYNETKKYTEVIEEEVTLEVEEEKEK